LRSVAAPKVKVGGHRGGGCGGGEEGGARRGCRRNFSSLQATDGGAITADSNVYKNSSERVSE